jgi:hypothetical protein
VLLSSLLGNYGLIGLFGSMGGRPSLVYLVSVSIHRSGTLMSDRMDREYYF